MMALSNNRWLIVMLGHFVALFFIGQINYYLAPTGFQIFVLGVLISFSALELNFKQGIFSLLPIGLLLDSKSPLPFGFTFFLCIVLFTLTHSVRSRIRREITASSLATSIVLNLLAYFVYTIGAYRMFSSEAIHFLPVALNLFANSVVVLLFNRLFFETQRGVLEIFGINLAEEQREAR